MTATKSKGRKPGREPFHSRPRQQLGGQQRHEEKSGGHRQGQVFPLGAGPADALLQFGHLGIKVIYKGGWKEKGGGGGGEEEEKNGRSDRNRLWGIPPPPPLLSATLSSGTSCTSPATGEP